MSDTNVVEPLAVRVPVACQMIGISRSKLYELIGAGTIKVKKCGNITLVNVASLRSFISTESA